MSTPEFELEIITQGWLNETAEDEYDLCSHGDVRVVVGGCVIADADSEGDYTISTSALALLRTLESGHSPEDPVADSLIMCCGMILMTSCPIGIDWSVSHLDGHVLIDDVVRCDSDGETRFPGLAVELAEDEYRRQVVGFAKTAKQLFEGVEKKTGGDVYQQLYEEFWKEYDARLTRVCRQRSRLWGGLAWAKTQHRRGRE